MWRFQSFSTQKHTRSDWHIKMWPNTIHTWQILAHLILSSLWKQNPDVMLQFHHDDWLQLDDRLLYFILSLFPLHSSRCANLFQLLHPTLNSGYRELKFRWRKSLQQTGTLTWNCPVFFLSQFFFFQNCLSILPIGKTDDYIFVWFTQTISVLNVICIDIDTNLLKTFNTTRKSLNI